MKILLINPPYKTDLSPGSFPLGLGYVAAALRDDGHSVEVYDIKAFRYTQIEVEHFVRRNMKRYDLVGITGMITIYSYIKWLTGLIKGVSPHIHIIVGGSAASSIPELILNNTGADIACIGEGEKTTVEVVNALEGNKSLEAIEGIYYKFGKEIVKNPPRFFIDNIDSVSFPAWDLFPMEIYLKQYLIVPVEDRSTNVIFSRGCPYTCTFCYRNFGNKVRVRSVNNMIEEMKVLKERYGVSHFEFQDELFIVDRKKTIRLCEAMIKEKINVSWRCLGRANLVDNDLLKLMREAGCRWIGFGVESGSQKMLDIMKKKVKADRVKEAIKAAGRAGMQVSGTFILGMPGETKETVRETVDFCKDVGIYNQFFFPVPYPGTELYVEAEKRGFIDNEESFVIKLGKDMTELIFNFTDFDDKQLIELKKNSEEEIKKYIECNDFSRDFKGLFWERNHNFTAHNSSAINKVIEGHLRFIANTLLNNLGNLVSLILVGGFGREEGSVIIEKEDIIPLNDYDIVLIAEGYVDTEKLMELSKSIADSIGIRHIDFSPFRVKDLPTLPPTQFNFDMKYGGYTFWGKELLGYIPPYSPEDIDEESARILLINRIICLLECYSDDFLTRNMSDEESFFLYQQASKVILALGEAILIDNKVYHSSIRERAETLKKLLVNDGKRIIDLHSWAVDFKLFPSLKKNRDEIALWREVLEEYLRVLPTFLENSTQGGTFLETDEIPASLYDYLSNPYYDGDKDVLERAEIALIATRSSKEPLRDLFCRLFVKYFNVMGNDFSGREDWEEMRKATVNAWFNMFH